MYIFVIYLIFDKSFLWLLLIEEMKMNVRAASDEDIEMGDEVGVDERPVVNREYVTIVQGKVIMYSRG